MSVPNVLTPDSQGDRRPGRPRPWVIGALTAATLVAVVSFAVEVSSMLAAVIATALAVPLAAWMTHATTEHDGWFYRAYLSLRTSAITAAIPWVAAHAEELLPHAPADSEVMLLLLFLSDMPWFVPLVLAGAAAFFVVSRPSAS